MKKDKDVFLSIMILLLFIGFIFFIATFWSDAMFLKAIAGAILISAVMMALRCDSDT
jgi:uncharacterized membrane protein YeiB